MTIRRAVVGAALLGPSFLSAEARANGLEFPSNGTEQMGRGSAWLARASDPLAVFYNPAALARNKTAASLTVNLTFEQRCFTRTGPGNTAVRVEVPNAGAQVAYRACNDNAKTPFPNPQIAFNWRVNDKLGVGIAVMGPSAYGGVDFGGTAKNASNRASDRGQIVEGPAGTRYMIGSLNNLLIWPQIAVGYEVAPNLRLGASFIWGVALMDLETYAIGANTSQTLVPNSADGKSYLQEDPSTDVKARIKARDYFVPGFVVSALYSATPNIDVAAWYHWSDAIKATGEAELDAFAFNGNLQTPGAGESVVRTRTPEGKTTLEAPQPMEARIGVRFHMPRPGAEPTNRIDPLHDDQFDVELDGEWSHDSQFDAIKVGFGGSPVVNTPASSEGGQGLSVGLPANSSVPHKWKDSFGVRLGGDYNVLPDRLAVRAGAWFQSSSIDAAYVYPDFFPTQRLGLTVGTTVRVKPVDIQLGYQHIFMKDQDNKGEGAIKGLTGTPGANNQSNYAINGGRMSGAANVFSIGAVARF